MSEEVSVGSWREIVRVSKRRSDYVSSAGSAGDEFEVGSAATGGMNEWEGVRVTAME